MTFIPKPIKMKNSENGLKAEEAIEAQNFKAAIPMSNHSQGLAIFRQLYSATNGLHYNTIKVQYSQQLKDLFRLTNHPSFGGLIFHYGFDPSTKKIVYLIGLGNFTGGAIIPSPLPNVIGSNPGYYEVSSDSASLQARSEIEFDESVKEYWCQILKKNPSSGNLEPISNDPDHARMVYHEKAELQAFDKEYENLINPHLYFDHGASYSRDHTPMLRFGDDSILFPIDDINYRNQYGMDEKYRNKAFNIGQLCPPDCGVAPPNC